VIGTVAPDPALRVVSEAPSAAQIASTGAPRKPARRTSRAVAADPALRAVPSATASASATASEPTGSPQVLGNG